MCPRMSKGKDPYYAGCGLYKCADGYIVMELVGITQIEECFKILASHICLARQKSRKALSLSTVSNALTAHWLKRNSMPGWRHIPSRK
ncbi:crotonobetainyl-CoA:carnitine CoA-transferase [Escherichia coli]|uniref:Crotonobetainyl-CoA:carnitine CoA-transferase n=1 Tax=Escherichia coli TaxID=562 RepID=A0A377CW80_ECOLX|nr:crotonobetainyl-CoA:carnitine CoA-transferase [Escherichia coli]